MAKPGFLAGLSTARTAALLAGVAVAIVVGSFALLGIPGALWLLAASPLARLFTARHAAADSAWPMALMMSLLWPAFIPIAYLCAAPRTAPGRPRVLWTLLLTAAASLALALVFQLQAGVLS